MDAGMLCNKDLCQVSSAEDAIEQGLLPLRLGTSDCAGLTTQDIVGISDELLCCMCTWLNGHSLAQTVLTCLYLHSVPRIKCPVLVSL